VDWHCIGLPMERQAATDCRRDNDGVCEPRIATEADCPLSRAVQCALAADFWPPAVRKTAARTSLPECRQGRDRAVQASSLNGRCTSEPAVEGSPNRRTGRGREHAFAGSETRLSRPLACAGRKQPAAASPTSSSQWRLHWRRSAWAAGTRHHR
jgi:hypothetical protein